MTRAYVGLGSNQGDSQLQLERALDALARLVRTSVIECSPFYRTAPVGDPDQPEFINAVVALETALAPLELLHGMQHIENELGRKRDPSRRWGPRTIDLDLLLFGDAVVQHPDLFVPHPRMRTRAFVLKPLADIAPRMNIPGMGNVAELLAELDTSGIKRWKNAPSDQGNS